MKIKQAWKLPIVFLIGYLFAWGSILLDRQMIIDEQEALRQELEQTKIEMKLREIVDDYGADWQEIVIWNEEAIESLEEVPDGQVGK